MFDFAMLLFWIFVAICLLVFFLKRLLAWLDRHGYITYTGHVPTYGSLGNAFLELQSLAEPHKKYVIEMREEQETKQEEDGEAGPPWLVGAVELSEELLGLADAELAEGAERLRGQSGGKPEVELDGQVAAAE